jgi:hypothetical protein
MAKKPEIEKTGADGTGPDLRDIEVPLGKIVRNPWNPRKTAVTEQEMEKLKSSVASVGQITPGIARPDPEKDGYFQIADGWLRFNILRALGMKTMRLEIKPLTDRQMKIFGIAANTSIQVRDSDWEKAVQDLYDTEFKPEAEASEHKQQQAADYPGLNAMVRETGIPKRSLLEALAGRDLREAIVVNAPKEVRRLVKPATATDPKVSTDVLYEIRDIIKNAPEAARVLIQGFDPENKVLKSRDLSEHVKIVNAAETPKEKEMVAQKIIERAREEKKIDERAKQETKKVLGEMVKPGGELTPEGRTDKREAEREQMDEEQAKREKEALKVAQTKAKVDTELKTTYELAVLEAQDLTSEGKRDQIRRIRDDSVRVATIEAFRTIAALWKKADEAFKGQ